MTSKDFITYFKKTYKNGTSSFLSGVMIMISDIIGLFCCIGIAFLFVNLISPPSINFRSFINYSFQKITIYNTPGRKGKNCM